MTRDEARAIEEAARLIMDAANALLVSAVGYQIAPGASRFSEAHVRMMIEAMEGEGGIKRIRRTLAP